VFGFQLIAFSAGFEWDCFRIRARIYYCQTAETYYVEQSFNRIWFNYYSGRSSKKCCTQV